MGLFLASLPFRSLEKVDEKMDQIGFLIITAMPGAGRGY